MTYDMIKRNYDRGLWNAQQVQVAVAAGAITQEQADAIYAGRPDPTVADVEIILNIIEGKEVSA